MDGKRPRDGTGVINVLPKTNLAANDAIAQSSRDCRRLYQGRLDTLEPPRVGEMARIQRYTGGQDTRAWWQQYGYLQRVGGRSAAQSL